MGGIVDALFGSDSGSDAAAAANVGSQLGIEELQRQFGITQANLAPFLAAGTGQLDALSSAATAGGLDERLAEIFSTDTFGSLVDERTRAVQSGLGAAGLTRSGQGIQELAAVPQDIGLMLEQLLQGRSQDLANTGLGAATGLGNIGQSNAASIANLFAQQGQNTASGILTDAQAQSAGIGQLFGAGASILGAFLSDPRLKTNVEQVSQILDLGVYQWDWVEGFPETLAARLPTIGFMATEVAEKYPQHVGNYYGFKTINYPALLDELDAANQRMEAA